MTGRATGANRASVDALRPNKYHAARADLKWRCHSFSYWDVLAEAEHLIFECTRMLEWDRHVRNTAATSTNGASHDEYPVHCARDIRGRGKPGDSGSEVAFCVTCCASILACDDAPIFRNRKTNSALCSLDMPLDRVLLCVFYRIQDTCKGR